MWETHHSIKNVSHSPRRYTNSVNQKQEIIRTNKLLTRKSEEISEKEKRLKTNADPKTCCSKTKGKKIWNLKYLEAVIRMVNVITSFYKFSDCCSGFQYLM